MFRHLTNDILNGSSSPPMTWERIRFPRRYAESRRTVLEDLYAALRSGALSWSHATITGNLRVQLRAMLAEEVAQFPSRLPLEMLSDGGCEGFKEDDRYAVLCVVGEWALRSPEGLSGFSARFADPESLSGAVLNGILNADIRWRGVRDAEDLLDAALERVLPGTVEYHVMSQRTQTALRGDLIRRAAQRLDEGSLRWSEVQCVTVRKHLEVQTLSRVISGGARLPRWLPPNSRARRHLVERVEASLLGRLRGMSRYEPRRVPQLNIESTVRRRLLPGLIRRATLGSLSEGLYRALARAVPSLFGELVTAISSKVIGTDDPSAAWQQNRAIWRRKPTLASAILERICEGGSDDRLVLLEGAVRSEDGVVLRAAAQALHHADADRAAPLLVRRLQGAIDEKIAAGLTSLVSAHRRAGVFLERVVNSGGSLVARIGALRELVRLGISTSIETCRSLARSSEPKALRMAAIDAIGRLGDRSEAAFLLETLVSERTRSIVRSAGRSIVNLAGRFPVEVMKHGRTRLAEIGSSKRALKRYVPLVEAMCGIAERYVGPALSDGVVDGVLPATVSYRDVEQELLADLGAALPVAVLEERRSVLEVLMSGSSLALDRLVGSFSRAVEQMDVRSNRLCHIRLREAKRIFDTEDVLLLIFVLMLRRLQWFVPLGFAETGDESAAYAT